MSLAGILQGSVHAILSCCTDPGRILGDRIHVESSSVTKKRKYSTPETQHYGVESGWTN